MNDLLVIEDGGEYEQFAQLFLGARMRVHAAHSAREALLALSAQHVDALLVDMRFDRAPSDALVGDVDATAQRLFGGDRARAESYLKDHQGALVLAELRRAGHRQPALFIHAFAPQQLANLQKLYAPVQAVTSFDARAVLRALGVEA
jgi:hypothetical protein